jgi:hypothetical protein
MVIMQYNKNVFSHEVPVLSMPIDSTPEDNKIYNLVHSTQYSKLNILTLDNCIDIDSAIFRPYGIGLKLTEFNKIKDYLNLLSSRKNSLSN